jgi:hypothetical protein
MSKTDAYEQDILTAFEKGRLKSVATKGELEKLQAAAGATAIKERRVWTKSLKKNRPSTL